MKGRTPQPIAYGLRAHRLGGDADIAAPAHLIGDEARAAMLLALGSGRPLSATELAAAARVRPQTASSHLTKLVAGGLLRVERSGRFRYYRIAGPDVSTAIEALGAIAPIKPVRRSATARKPKGCASREPVTITSPENSALRYSRRSSIVRRCAMSTLATAHRRSAARLSAR